MKKLAGVHPDLVRVVRRLIDEGVQFKVIEGVRSLERQRALFAAGKSKTMNSRHLTGHAVDLAPVVKGQILWDWPLFDTPGGGRDGRRQGRERAPRVGRELD